MALVFNALVRSSFFVALLICQSHLQAGMPDTDWTAMRLKAINRPRPLIFNNDGNEPVYFCKAATAEDLLRPRTTPLIGSKVSTIFYCTWSSGFGLFTHHTKVGQLFDTREGLFRENRTREFLEKGIDPLKVMVEFGRTNGIEIFWSMRMNDTHDGSRAEYGPIMFRANRLKNAHPEWLISTKEKPPKYGSWSAVDYARPEIRNLAFRYCEEVLRNYDVDGIELDFFRHAFFFKCSANNESCGPAEWEQMTSLLRRIRATAEDAGRKRGRPILLAVRVPDSVEYCRFIGLDLEKWLSDRLVDMLVVSGYTQLNPWEYSVRLARKYGVTVYPSLDEPRLRDKDANSIRATLPAYRGRALAAWAAGVDGIYMFNYFDPASPLWQELHDPETLRHLERLYFPSVRGVGSVPVPHQTFMHVPTLNPAKPISVRKGETARVTFQTGESAGSLKVAQPTLLLRAQPVDTLKKSKVRLNDVSLTSPREVGTGLEYRLPPGSLRPGKNTLEVEASAAEPVTLLDAFAAVASPQK